MLPLNTLAMQRSDAAFAFLMDKSGLTIAAIYYQQPLSFVGQNCCRSQA
jgi:C4-dicarboxylate-specific signal transduction histidine kinase